MSVKTANKDGQKYLNKQGGQAYRVSVKIGEEWYGNMIWEEDLLPKKGQEYEIELSENDGFKNWVYKLKSKAEQIKEQTQPQYAPPPEEYATKEEVSATFTHTPPKDDYQIKVSRGASLNLASQYTIYKACGGELGLQNWITEIEQLANEIQPRQAKHVNN